MSYVIPQHSILIQIRIVYLLIFMEIQPMLIELKLWQIFFVLLPAGIACGAVTRYFELNVYIQTVAVSVLTIFLMLMFSFFNKRVIK